MLFFKIKHVLLYSFLVFALYPALQAAVIKPIMQTTSQESVILAKSKFNFSLNIGPQTPYPVYTPPPVYRPYWPPRYPVYREYYSYPAYPVIEERYSQMVCFYDNWGNPYNCHWEYY